MGTPLPTGFVGHGSPVNALGGAVADAWARWGEALERPTAVLVVSAHFEAQPPTLTASSPLPLVYDFWGFPEEMYRILYAAPAALRVSNLVEGLLGAEVRRDEERGLDHGAWVPLSVMFPDADVPVVQLSIPWTDDPARMLDLGRRLAPLRDDGVFILGSGNIVHNLRRVDWSGGPTPGWAEEFDGWAAETLRSGDAPLLADYRAHGLAGVCHPTHEHFVPLLVAAGASGEHDEISFPVTGFELGSVSSRAVQLGR